MNPTTATFAYVLGIAGLFYLDRDRSTRTSPALWIPVIWFWILGSRAVSVWLGLGAVNPTSVDQAQEGSPIDAAVFGALLVGGLIVLAQRQRQCMAALVRNGPIAAYILYCLVSAAWSDYPDVAAKRWFKANGDLVMALIVVTDPQPTAAIRKLLSRVGFVLLPMSILFIKYYPDLGRAYDPWNGTTFYVGVNTNKNLLGVITFVLALGSLWQVLRLWPGRRMPNQKRQLIAQCILVSCGLWILATADAVTSIVCFALGCGVLLITASRRLRRPSSLHALIAIAVVSVVLLKALGVDEEVMRALGRSPELTGRANEIWPLVISMAPNGLIGAGFESFWLGPRLQKIWDAFPNLFLNEAHNGYIEVYVNLGMVGIGLLLWALARGYRKSVAAFSIDRDYASLLLAYLLTIIIFSYTEAGFRMLSFSWGFLLLAIVGASYLPTRDVRKPAGVRAPAQRLASPSPV
jgi:hypothetical protein